MRPRSDSEVKGTSEGFPAAAGKRARLLNLLLLSSPPPGGRRPARTGAQATVPVATSALGPTQRPHEAIWAPIGDESLRLRLAELAGVPIPAESEERIAETRAYRRRSDEQR